MAAAADLQVGLAPVVQALGVDLEEVQVQGAGRRTVVRIVVDRDGGVDLDCVAEVTRVVSAALDAGPLADVIVGPFLLEVTSPGVDRPLTTPTHWRRALGRLVRADLADGDIVEGRVADIDGETVTLTVDGESRQVPLAQIRRAVVQVEFGNQDD
ncbi:MAG: ribosome maturation factor RimP [Actinomycetales bacterium]